MLGSCDHPGRRGRRSLTDLAQGEWATHVIVASMKAGVTIGIAAGTIGVWDGCRCVIVIVVGSPGGGWVVGVVVVVPF